MYLNENGLEIDCATAEEVRAAIAKKQIPRITASMRLEISVNVRLKVTAGRLVLMPLGASQAHLETRGSSQAHLVTRESSQAHLVTRESSQAHLETRESSQAHLVTRESSQADVQASGISQLSLSGRVNVKAGKCVGIAVRGAMLAQIEGGAFVAHAALNTSEEWCEFYGVRIVDGCAVLFKGLDDKFRAQQRSFLYQPGETQEAPDWDPNPERECGGGLHFSPTPRHTHEFVGAPKRYVGCLVPLATLFTHPNGEHPAKVRAKETRGCWECDVNGKWIGEIKPPFLGAPVST